MAAWLSLFLLLSGSSQAASSTTQESAKCAIEGTVLKAASGEPLKKARVVLQSMQGRAEPIVVVTDASGRFALKDLEAGRYRFWAERDGYVRMEYGQRSLQRPAAPLNLTAGQRLRDVVFRMVAGAAMGGRIFDEDGEPLAWASVQVLRSAYVGSQRHLLGVARATTNDLGEFRLWGLPPGRYFLSVTYARGVSPGWAAGAGVSQPTRASAADESFGATYFPGTTDPSRAAGIALHAGEEALHLDVSLHRVQTFRIRGRVVNTVREPPSGSPYVYLQSRDIGPLLPPTSAVVNDADGSFEIRSVVPGSYVVIAQWNSEDQESYARQAVEVGTADVEGVKLVITRGVDLPGRVHVEGPTSAPLTGLMVWLGPKEGLGGGSIVASVKEDGSFLLQNLNGDYELGVAQVPEDFYLKSVRLGGSDALENGVSGSGAAKGNALEVVISAAGGRVEGTVLDKEGQGFGGAVVVLIPKVRSAGRLYKSVTSDSNGRFALRGITPGEYKIFAWEDIEPNAFRDPDFLRPFEGRGETIHVEENGRHTLELKVIPADSPTGL